jgi:hypothetical protein
MTQFHEALAALDRRWPKAGPCWICGGPDKRHRLWDAIVDRLDAGESERSVGNDLSVSRLDMAELRYAYRLARKQHRALPGRYSL